MFSRLALLCFAVIISSSLPDQPARRSRGIYSIVAPGTIRPYSYFQVSVSLDDYHQSAAFNISLYIGRGNPIVTTVEVEPETTKLVKMQIPSIFDTSAEWDVRGIKGIISHDFGTLHVERHNFTMYIQTDKAKYKPGEVVLFRLICIDRLTRPAMINEQLKVSFYDKDYKLMKEFKDVKLVQGVFRGEFQLSENTLLGEWVIEASVDGRTDVRRTFEVARYTLPAFVVEIDTKKDIALIDGRIDLTIRAKYFHGGPINGTLSLSVGPKSYTSQKVLKETQIYGETSITLDPKAEFNLFSSPKFRSMNIFVYNFDVTVQDALTHQSSQATAKVSIHNSPFKIKITCPQSYNPNELLNVSVSVVDIDNKPVKDAENPIILFGETGYIDSSGVAIFHLDMSGSTDETSVWLTATYLGWMSFPKIVTKKIEIFSLDVLTEKPEVGQELVIRLNSVDVIDYFVYEIVARGNIVLSDRMKVPSKETTCLLRLNVTYVMVPKMTIFVHRTKGGTFDSRLKDVLIKGGFENSIEIDVDQEVEPGALVSVNVTTNEGSYVGLAGVDERLLINSATQNDLSEREVLFNLNKYDSVSVDNLDYPGSEAGLSTFTNSLTREGYDIGITDDKIFGGAPGPTRFAKPKIELIRIRNLFTDSWLFEDFERSPKEGLHIRRTVPDSITTWALTGFSLNSKTGFSLTKNVTKLKVFQPFFVALDLPSLVKEGEIIETPVYVFNYMDQDLETDVTIESDSENIEFLNNPTKGSEISPNQTFSKSIPAQGKVKLMFFIRPRKSGQYNLTVKAISSAANDAVQKPLTVEFEGVPHSFSKTYLVHFLQDGEQEDMLLIDIPRTAVPGSERVQLSVVGDVFGPLVRSLQKLARVPHGNGEENMKNFMSNVLVLKYLKTFNHSNPSLESKTRLHLELGYQTQMVFKHLDGSFSLFDRTKERTGDLWVTAYVMWGLQQASEHITVDHNVIRRGLEYLQKKQNEKGAISRGRGLEDDVGVTAFTLLAFMVTEESRMRAQDSLKKGLDFLFQSLDELEEATNSAIAKYVLILGKHEKSSELLSELKSSSGITSTQMEWIKQDTLQSSLEVTAGSFMSLLQSQTTPVETLFPVVRALALSVSADKTPVHLVALDAMIKIAHDMEFGSKDLTINFTSDQGESENLHVDSENAHLQQAVELKGSSRKVRVKTKGHGFAVVNIKYEYNLPQLDEPSSSLFTINSTVKESIDMAMVLEVCLAARSSENRSNLTVLEVNLQSGYDISDRTFDVVVEKNELIKSIQLERNAGFVRAYIKNLDKNGTCVQLEALKTYKVLERKPISIVVYDAYNEQTRFTSLHEVND